MTCQCAARGQAPPRTSTRKLHLPGFEPKPKKARAKVDSGVAAACTCSKASGRKTKVCPCFAVAKESKCIELCVGCVKHVKKCVGHLSLRG